MNPRLLRAQEVMKLLGISRYHLNKYLEQGIFTKVHLPGSSYWRIPLNDIQKYVDVVINQDT